MADPPAVDDDFNYKPLDEHIIQTTKAAFDNLPETGMVLPWWLLGLVKLISEGAMVFGGVVPFIPQMSQIRRTRTCEGFNTLVSVGIKVQQAGTCAF